jgi:hypothetical protein
MCIKKFQSIRNNETIGLIKLPCSGNSKEMSQTKSIDMPSKNKLTNTATNNKTQPRPILKKPKDSFSHYQTNRTSPPAFYTGNEVAHDLEEDQNFISKISHLNDSIDTVSATISQKEGNLLIHLLRRFVP